MTKFLIEELKINGRTSRLRYQFSMLIYICVFLFLEFTIERFPIVIILLIFVIPCILALQIRRLHDLNMSGWWLLLAIILVSLVIQPALFLLLQHYGFNNLLNWLDSSIFFCIFYLVTFGTLEGSKGVNKYGAPPQHPLSKSPNKKRQGRTPAFSKRKS